MRAISVLAVLSALVAACHACLPNGSDNSVTIGEDTHVCISFSGKTWSHFTPTADDFSMLKVQGSNVKVPLNTGYFLKGGGWTNNVTQEAGKELYLTMTVESNGISSTQGAKVYKRIVYSASGVSAVYTIPVFTAVILVNNGAVEDVVWDDGCFFCDGGGEDCIYNSVKTGTTTNYQLNEDSEFEGCRLETSGCTVASTECASDLKVFVVWQGTDSKGNFFRSAGFRFSRYRAYGASGLYEAAENAASTGVSDAGNAGNSASIPTP